MFERGCLTPHSSATRHLLPTTDSPPRPKQAHNGHRTTGTATAHQLTHSWWYPSGSMMTAKYGIGNCPSSQLPSHTSVGWGKAGGGDRREPSAVARQDSGRRSLGCRLWASSSVRYHHPSRWRQQVSSFYLIKLHLHSGTPLGESKGPGRDAYLSTRTYLGSQRPLKS